MKYYAGLDVGGTSGRVKFCKDSKEAIGEYIGQGCAFNTEGEATGREKYNRLMKEAMDKYGLKAEDCQGICIAASGVDSQIQQMQLHNIFKDMGFEDDKILAVNDCELFLYLSEGNVFVVISGTGSICYGRDKTQKTVRCGGWNHILSDEGSAYDIGLQSIKAMADHMDGRIEAPLLCRMLQEKTNITTLEEADRYVNEHLFDKSPVGALAGVCAKAADLGDETALKILEECSEKIFRLVYDTYIKLGIERGECADLWLWGSVNVKNEKFQKHLRTRIAEVLPELEVKVPEKTALDTALEVAVQRFKA